MKPIEDILADKIYELVNYVLAKKIKPDMKLETVGSLTKDDIRKLKEELGVQGVILDIDETVRKDMKSIPKCNQEWIEMLKSQLKVIVVSNGVDKGIENFFKLQGIDYIGFAHKPMKKNFIHILNQKQYLMLIHVLLDSMLMDKQCIVTRVQCLKLFHIFTLI